MSGKDTIQKRLTGLFVLLGGIALLICLFTMCFWLAFNQRYQKAIEQMTVFNQYCVDADTALENLKYYYDVEDEEYYEKSLSYMEAAIEEAETLYEREQNPQIKREFQDICEITEYMSDCQKTFYEDMQEYLADGAGTASARLEKDYEAAQKVYETLSGQFQEINRMLLQDINVSYDRIRSRAGIFMALFLALFAGACGFFLWKIRYISQSISEPIYVLTRKAEQVKAGKLEEARLLPAPANSDRELRALTEVFNEMTGQVKRQIETVQENARVRHELEESRFRELQMQINPHFLFNTLNMIAEKAYLEHAEETELLLESAARMFRFSLDFSGKTIRLAKEIEELGVYVFMQEQRFGERIRFQFELDERFHDVQVPALILQPLVENAITHGIGMRTSDAMVRIRTSLVEPEELGYVIIEDNGEGMSREKLAQVRRDMERYSQQSGMKVGLGNVYLRIRMFYQGKAHMSIDSREGQGTRVTLKLPWAGKQSAQSHESSVNGASCQDSVSSAGRQDSVSCAATSRQVPPHDRCYLTTKNKQGDCKCIS